MLCSTNGSKKVVTFALSLLIGFCSMGLKADAQPGKYLQQRQALPARAVSQRFMPDTLMITPARNVTDSQLNEMSEAAGCKLVDTIGKGAYRIIVLKTPKGKLEETEKRLKKDEHVWLMQRDYMAEETGGGANDSQEPIIRDGKNGRGSFLQLVKADTAWPLGSTGAGQTIAIIDDGCQTDMAELQGKCDKGFDATTIDAKLSLGSSPMGAATAAAVGGPVGLVVGVVVGVGANVVGNAVNPGIKTDKDSRNSDNDLIKGHGTMVATVAAGAINGQHACGVAPDARIYPIGGGDDIAICAGIWHLITTGGPKILNISRGPLGDASKSPIDHLAFQLYHDTYGGITFISAGNHGEKLGGDAHSYVNVVSMTDSAGKFVELGSLAPGKGSAQGKCVTFAAQGVMVDTVDRLGADESSGGTSFSSPTCAGVAALVWAANPRLKNTQVELLMKQHAYIPAGVTYDPVKYGYGIPDAKATVQAALGLAAAGLGG